MYIQLVDKDNFKSPILYIHSDEEEFMEQIDIWLKQVRETIKEFPTLDGLPFGRLDPDVCMVDLVRHLGNYYVENTPLSFAPPRHVYSCLRLIDGNSIDIYTDEIHEINLHKEKSHA